jgi:hypothetical protein
VRRYPSSPDGSSPQPVVAADGPIHGHTVGRQSDGSMTAGVAPGRSGARAILLDGSPFNGTWLPGPCPKHRPPSVRTPVVELAAGCESAAASVNSQGTHRKHS